MQLWIGLILATYQQLGKEQRRHLLHLEHHHSVSFRGFQMPDVTGYHVGPHLSVEPPIIRRKRWKSLPPFDRILCPMSMCAPLHQVNKANYKRKMACMSQSKGSIIVQFNTIWELYVDPCNRCVAVIILTKNKTVMFVAVRRVQQHNLRWLHAQRRSSSNAYQVLYLSSSWSMSVQRSCMPKMIEIAS